MYKAMTIATYVIRKSLELRNPIDNLKLQKLLYYIQGASLRNNKTLMFNDDIYAYMYGPVVRNVYEKYRWNVGMSISYIEDEDKAEFIQLEDQKIIDFIIDKYKDNTSWSLVEKTHEEAPWLDTIEGFVIENKKLEKFFKDNDEYKYNL